MSLLCRVLAGMVSDRTFDPCFVPSALGSSLFGYLSLPWVEDAVVVAVAVGKVKAMRGTDLLSTSAVSTATSFSASGSFAPTPTITACSDYCTAHL